MSILTSIKNSFVEYPDRNAFCINEKYYSYQNLLDCVIEKRLFLRNSPDGGLRIGIVANNDLETYATIIAIWLEGKCYIPLNTSWPSHRISEIKQQAGIKLTLDSSIIPNIQISNKEDSHIDYELFLRDDFYQSDDELAYILFTSGSTGKPKGVPISRHNVSSFISAFYDLGYKVSDHDRFLQCFDLTFDLSVVSYLIPLMNGACVYTIPSAGPRYLATSMVLDEYKLTFALMTPSTIMFLKPYFDEIYLPDLRYSLFCGEALPESITSEWAGCVPNAIIDNVYGPTENTIFCSSYRYCTDKSNNTYNGILPIGKPMAHCLMKVFDQYDNETANGEPGELCLAGSQLTAGYLDDPKSNSESFFIKDNIWWYRSGDICYMNSEGNIMYVERKDCQVKVQGYRIELGEIEYYAHEFLPSTPLVVISVDYITGISEIVMFIKSEQFDTAGLYNFLQNKLPFYMLPGKIQFVNEIPTTSSGKIDRNKLKEIYKNV